MTTEQTDEQKTRPLFVKSTNFKHSVTLQFPDEPPTDRQVKLLVRLGFKGDIPYNRKQASDIIKSLLSPSGVKA